MYAGDSLFTLTPPQIAGLIVLSAAVFVAWIWVARRLGRATPWLSALILGFVLFWLFLWLTPQIYYTYYRLIIPGLPAQIVIKSPPGPGHVLQNLIFQAGHSIADHARGLLGWAILAAAIFHRREPLD